MAPPASAGWLAPLPLSAPDRQAIFPAVALGADGQLMAAWSRSDGTHFRIEAALRSPGGTLEAPQIVSEAGVDAAPAQVALDAQGNAVLMWIRGQSYQWATRAAGAGAFGDLHTVSLPAAERASSFRLAVAPNGQAAATILTHEDVTMTDNRSRVRAMTRAPGGDFELSAVLDEGLDNGDDVYSFGPVDMDADAQGGFYATWTRSHSLSATHSTSDVRVAVRPAGAGSFAVEGVSTGVADSGDLFRDTTVGAGRAGVDAAGNLIVGYTLRLSDVSPEEAEVRLRSRPAGGPFQAGSEAVTPASQPNGPSELALAANPSGTGVIAWRRGNAAAAAIEACVRPPGGPCGPTQPLGSVNVVAPVVAIGAGGEMVAAWRRTAGAADASFGTAAGGFGPVHDLGSATQVLVSQEGTAVDALGHAVVATDHFNFPSRTVEAYVNDPVAPSISSLTAPAGGAPGAPLAFGGSVSDVWGPVTAGVGLRGRVVGRRPGCNARLPGAGGVHGSAHRHGRRRERHQRVSTGPDHGHGGARGALLRHDVPRVRRWRAEHAARGRTASGPARHGLPLQALGDRLGANRHRARAAGAALTGALPKALAAPPRPSALHPLGAPGRAAARWGRGRQSRSVQRTARAPLDRPGPPPGCPGRHGRGRQRIAGQARELQGGAPLGCGAP